MNKLLAINNFTLGDNGVYSLAGDMPDFAYSDGQESERYLSQVLNNAEDISSHSLELESHIIDWPSEYHLSSTRANILRSLDLSKVNRILELGCGCGSISRYLGEQLHLIIDSIEGSPSRAAIAAIRCRDQHNVSIYTANFNDIELPENYYDVVLFIGVTEYARSFFRAKF